MKIIIIGTGNVATVLGKRIRLAGHEMLGVYGRTEQHARQLGALLGTEGYLLNGNAMHSGADLYLVAVSDSALPELASTLKLDRQLIVHTAGSVSKEVLSGCSSNYGVLYPLQSLRKELDPQTEIPLLTDANSGTARAQLREFARSLSPHTGEATDEQRSKLHVAAVIASNFVNHLYTLADAYCQAEQLDFDLLLPLIRETASRVGELPPSALQTGPAIRGDESTLRRHLELLDSHPALKQLYSVLTASIRENG